MFSSICYMIKSQYELCSRKKVSTEFLSVFRGYENISNLPKKTYFFSLFDTLCNKLGNEANKIVKRWYHFQ